ncbi:MULTISPECIES: hypothetical protein [Helcococcus]|uniref:Uncharacterized protein n=1 Tax=Helcococcus bovis TaxID=3153252 RepID=A0ABW9F672_9FIRM
MKQTLIIRYENTKQEVLVDMEEMKDFLNVDLVDDEDLQEKIQEEFNKEFNRPEYNNWHKFNRHRGYSKKKADSETGILESYEPLIEEILDERIFNKNESAYQKEKEIKEIEVAIREYFVNKKEWAELFIQIKFHDVPIREYARKTTKREDGMTDKEYKKLLDRVENNISKKLNRATKKLKKELEASDFDIREGYLIEAIKGLK